MKSPITLPLNNAAEQAILTAQSKAKEYHQAQFSGGHLLWGLLQEDAGLHPFLEDLGQNIHRLRAWAQLRIENAPKSAHSVDAPGSDEQAQNILQEAYRLRSKRFEAKINELMKKGRTEEAKLAKDNIITRAVQGSSVKKITLDIHTSTDIQPGDYFLLCSDGVWGVIPDDKLVTILADDDLNANKMNFIHQICKAHSRDNFSAYLIEIKDVEKNGIPENTIGYSTQDDDTSDSKDSISIRSDESSQKQELISTEFDGRRSEFSKEIIIENTDKKRLPWQPFVLILFILGILILVLWQNGYFEAIF